MTLEAPIAPERYRPAGFTAKTATLGAFTRDFTHNAPLWRRSGARGLDGRLTRANRGGRVVAAMLKLNQLVANALRDVPSAVT